MTYALCPGHSDTASSNISTGIITICSTSNQPCGGERETLNLKTAGSTPLFGCSYYVPFCYFIHRRSMLDSIRKFPVSFPSLVSLLMSCNMALKYARTLVFPASCEMRNLRRDRSTLGQLHGALEGQNDRQDGSRIECHRSFFSMFDPAALSIIECPARWADGSVLDQYSQ